jgi:hypothetical protein
MQTSRTGDLWLTFGHPLTNQTPTGYWEYDNIRFQTGERIVVVANSLDQAGTSKYQNVEHWSFGKVEDGLMFVPFHRSDFSITTGLPGTWNDGVSKDKTVCSGSDGKFYLILSGQDSVNTYRLGAYSKTVVTGIWTPYSNNPILGAGSGFAPYLVEDLGDNAQKWKLFYASIDGNGATQIHLVTSDSANPLTNTWTYRGVVVQTGVNYSWDHQHVSNPVAFKYDGLWNVWYAGSSTGVVNNTWGYGRATGSDLLGLQKDVNNPIYAKKPFPVLQITGVTNIDNDWIVPCVSSILFETGSIVVITDDGDGDKYMISKVRKTTSAHVELYHQINAVTGGGITQVNAGSNTIHAIIPVSSGWYFYTTPFNTFRDLDLNLRVSHESCGVQFATNLTGVRNYNWDLGLSIYCRGNDDSSMENIALYKLPIPSSVLAGGFLGVGHMFVPNMFHSFLFGK